MAPPLPSALLLALVAPALLAADMGLEGGLEGGLAEGQVTTMTFHERIIVRVPRLVGPPAPPPTTIVWKEHRGPKCIAAAELAGAFVTQPDVVDLVLVGNRRIRARLNGRCEPLDFYSGFYLKPSADGKICAGRDAIRARSGVSCGIDNLRQLKPVVRKASIP